MVPVECVNIGFLPFDYSFLFFFPRLWNLKRENDGNSFQVQQGTTGGTKNSPQSQVDNAHWNNNNNDGSVNTTNGGCPDSQNNSAAERHQMLSSKLKTLIQNRQSSKQTNVNGNDHSSAAEPYYGSTIFVSAPNPGISTSNLTYTNGVSVGEHTSVRFQFCSFFSFIFPFSFIFFFLFQFLLFQFLLLFHYFFSLPVSLFSVISEKFQDLTCIFSFLEYGHWLC